MQRRLGAPHAHALEPRASPSSGTCNASNCFACRQPKLCQWRRERKHRVGMWGLAGRHVSRHDSQKKMWMGTWGLFDQPAASFLAGRPLRVLAAPQQTLLLPGVFQRQAYNPSVVAIPKALAESLGCSSCAMVASVRIDWMTQCRGFTGPLRMYSHASRTAFGRRKATLIMLLSASWRPLHWSWLRSHDAAAGRAPAAARNASRRSGRGGNRKLPDVAPLLEASALKGLLPVVDARLTAHGGGVSLLGTFPRRGYASGFGPLHLRLVGSPASLVATLGGGDGPGRTVGDRKAASDKRCGGRSQSFFERQPPASGAAPSRELYFMSWLSPGVVCTSRLEKNVSRGQRRRARVDSVAHVTRGLDWMRVGAHPTAAASPSVCGWRPSGGTLLL